MAVTWSTEVLSSGVFGSLGAWSAWSACVRYCWCRACWCITRRCAWRVDQNGIKGKTYLELAIFEY
ncbi:hypothetical protein C2G38_2223883 [Gigaspora rosea]|uniref:Uncharacterized protein n=1 Tax=Gigaspora rosea TaxID=44941 RepID=A0A397U2J0_9GLOM|nr:hypothetical protein C2G38_2223883 [Gigaspora rosea]